MDWTHWNPWGIGGAGLITNGLDAHRLAKASALEMDLAHIELEDGVPVDRKAEARETIVEALRGNDWNAALTVVRVCSIEDGFAEDDVHVVSAGRPTAFLLGKCAGPEDVVAFDALITRAERHHELPEGSIKIMSMIERARAFEKCEEIARASPRMAGLYIGPSDLGTELGYRRTYSGQELETLYVRSRIVAAAHAAGLLAIAPCYGPYDDDEATYEAARWLYQLGFDAVTTFTPRQVPIVARAFSPTEAELTWAREILAGAQDAEARGDGAWVVQGQMVDAPHVARARRILGAPVVQGEAR